MAATYLQPHAIRYDRHTTAIRLFGGLQPDTLQPPYDCNQIRPPYDRHTSVWRSVYGCNRLQPDTTAIRLQPDTLQPPYVCLEVCLFSCLVVSGFSCCNRSATAIRLQPPYVCNQERRPPYVIHVIGDHKICLRYRRYRRYRTLEKLRAGEALFFVLYIIYII